MNITCLGCIWSVFLLDHPEAVNDGATLVIGYLLKVQMTGIVCLEAQIAKVLAVEGAPWWHFLKEWLTTLMIARRSGDDVHRCSWIHIWLRQRAIVHGIVVHWPHALIAVLVRPQLHVHAILVEERLKTKEIQTGQTFAHDRLMIGAIVAVVIAAVHRPMAICDDPRTLGTILWLRRFNQITFEPIILHDNRFDAELREVVDLGAEANKVYRSQVETIE